MNARFEKIHEFWNELRIFAFDNRTVFESIFIISYTIEQAALVILTYLLPQYSLLCVSLFAILVLSTFAVHKLAMESRIKILENNVVELKRANNENLAELRAIKGWYCRTGKLFGKMSQKLY
ncbi:MAG: hypothetical protein ABIB71_08410 [Candidatus Woesearchaeota archaeon]